MSAEAARSAGDWMAAAAWEATDAMARAEMWEEPAVALKVVSEGSRGKAAEGATELPRRRRAWHPCLRPRQESRQIL